MERPSTNAGWSSRNMMILGTIILVFLVTHMQNFWWQMHFGSVPMQTLEDGTQIKDLYFVVAAFFHPDNGFALPAIGLYLLGQFALGFHLVARLFERFPVHGFASPSFFCLVGGLGKAFSVVVPALFSAIVVFLYFTQA